MKKSISTLLFIIILTISGKAQNYTGEIFKNPPDTIPKIFGKGVITIVGRAEYGLAISPSYDEILFTASDPVNSLMSMKKKKDGVWAAPAEINFRDKNFWEFEAFFNNSGDKIFFTSRDEKKIGANHFYYVEKIDSGWGKAKYLQSWVNRTQVMWCTFTSENTMYYGNNLDYKIYRSELVDGKYSRTNDVGIKGVHPTVAADESYILFNSRKHGGFGMHDIFIVFKTDEGNWTAPENLGKNINTSVHETCPSISPDGKFIFFSRYNDLNDNPDIYWVSSSVIDKLRKKVIK